MKKIINHLKENWIRHGFETLVVVVGILGAFSLSSWNESRKQRKLEIEILNEIRSNLIEDFVDHDENLGFLQQVTESTEIVLDHLNNDLPYHDSLEFHFAWLPMSANFDAISSGYDRWISEGARTISNDSLRMRISKVYSKDYTWLRSFLKDRHHLDNQPLKIQMLTKFKEFEFLSYAIPRDYEALKTDDDFKVMVQSNGDMIRQTRGFYERITSECRRLINDIANEVERLEN